MESTVKAMTKAVEAFFDSNPLGALGPSTYRAGYRCAETGHIICLIELPAATAETTVLQNTKLVVLVTPDGRIESTIDGGANYMSAFITKPIDELIVQSLSIENLRLEETSIADLNGLLQRLERSTAFVRKAIEELASPLACRQT